jgi:hypothetical protein
MSDDFTTKITIGAVNTAVGSATVAPALATDYNGFSCSISMTKNDEYVKDISKLVLSAPAAGAGGATSINMKETLVHKMWVIQGKPTAAVDVTQEHVNQFVEHARVMVAQMTILKISDASGIAICLRNSDSVPNTTVPNVARKERAVTEIVAIIIDDFEEKAKVSCVGRRCLQAAEANAIHREQNGDHSWYTQNTMIARSPTGKACTIAGAEIEDFKRFMVIWGHDIWHFLENSTLANIALAIAGGGMALVNAPGLHYDGEDINGRALKEIFYVGEAARGRYPAGILGKAAIIITCQMATGMLSHIMGKVLVKGAHDVAPMIEKVRLAVAASTFTHEQLIALDAALSNVVALTYGYCTEAEIVGEDEYLAFSNHAKRNPGMITVGRGLAKNVMAAIAHKGAVEGGIEASVATIATAFSAIATAVPKGATDPLVDGAKDIDTTKINAETGEDMSSKLMNAMIDGSLGGAVAAKSSAAPGASAP